MFKDNNYAVVFMGLITLFGFSLLAWPLLWIQNISLDSLFFISNFDIFKIPLFISFGIIFGLLMIWLTELTMFENALDQIKNKTEFLYLNNFFVVFLSISAGIGEEVFFRGTIQPFEGVISTAIIFVAIHGYYSLTNWTINIFGIILTLFIILLGWATHHYSIWLAISAHFSYDLVLLFYYKKRQLV